MIGQEVQATAGNGKKREGGREGEKEEIKNWKDGI